MSDNYLAMSESAEMGQITRDFKYALGVFTDSAQQEVEEMEVCVQHFSIQGHDDLPAEIRRFLSEKVNAIREDVQHLEGLLPKLEEKARGYDEFVEQLWSSMKTIL